MKIAFYAPLKSPQHPVPSGDRQMARALIKALRHGGHQVEIASDLRCFSKTPHDEHMRGLAAKEAERIITRWHKEGADGPPDLWFSYHPYYKAPDFIALEVLKSIAIRIVTAESSLALKRDNDQWQASQHCVRQLLRQSRANFYFTDRDLPGLKTEVDDNKLVHLPPFIDATDASATDASATDTSAKGTSTKDTGATDTQNHSKGPVNGPVQLITMGMMRGGVKLQSYALLADALGKIDQADWHLTIIGDGEKRRDVEGLFNSFAPDKISWAGEVSPQAVHPLLTQGDIFVWPGFGEAYGLAYLEAQAAGLPVVGQNTHGVPFAVKDGETAILVPPDDATAYAQAILKLINDQQLRQQLSANAARFVHGERNLQTASQVLDRTIRRI